MPNVSYHLIRYVQNVNSYCFFVLRVLFISASFDVSSVKMISGDVETWNMFFESLLSQKVMIGLQHPTVGVVREAYIPDGLLYCFNDLHFYRALSCVRNIGFSNT